MPRSSARSASRSHIMASSPKSNHSNAQAPNALMGSPIEEHSHSFHHLSAKRSHDTANNSNRRVSHPNHILAKQSGFEHHHDYDMHAGAEPGIDPSSGTAIAEYSHFQQECVIDVIDYDYDDITFRRFTNEGLISMLKESSKPDPTNDDESLPPQMVRWINIGGIDWNVMSAVALRYNIHSLALEDILHERGHNHSKADYYPGHLFIRVLSHSLQLDDHESIFEKGTETPPWTMANESAQPNQNPYVLNTGNPQDLDLEGGGYDIFKENGVKSSPVPLEYNIDPLRQTSMDASHPPSKGKDKAEPRLFGLPNLLHLPPYKKRFTGLSGFGGDARERKKRAINALKKGDRVEVQHEPMFIFLLSNGTVISIRTTPSLDFTSPIKERLHRPNSILRVSEDASLLVEALLDLIVDCILEVIDEYQVKISQLEHDILLHPITRSVRSLHILSGDIIMHKRTLEPIKTMIYGLRHYDLQRAQAILDHMSHEHRNTMIDTDSETNADVNEGGGTGTDNQRPPGHRSAEKSRRRRERKRAMLKAERSRALNPSRNYVPAESGSNAPGDGILPDVDHDKAHQVHGYFSFKAKVYLADVSDHMDFAITSLDMFADISENLLNYAFNIASYDMNVIMNRLTITTIVFLPLTLLTGYFGMNFTSFWSINHNSDFFFWKIAIPAMAVLIPVLMYNDIKNALGYFARRATTGRIIREFERKKR